MKKFKTFCMAMAVSLFVTGCTLTPANSEAAQNMVRDWVSFAVEMLALVPAAI